MNTLSRCLRPHLNTKSREERPSTFLFLFERQLLKVFGLLVSLVNSISIGATGVAIDIIRAACAFSCGVHASVVVVVACCM